MPLFRTTYRDSSGATRIEQRTADSAGALVAELRAHGHVVLGVRDAGRNASPETPPWHPAWLLPVTSLDVELGLRQLASMLRSDVPLLLSLKTVAEQAWRCWCCSCKSAAR